MKGASLSPAAAAAILLLTAFPGANTAAAGEKEDALVAKVIAAYGGDRLINLQGLTVNETRTVATAGQGYTSDYVEFADTKRIIQFDFANQRGGFESWSQSNNGAFQARLIFDGENGSNINYATGTYTSLPNLFAVTGGFARTVDALVARDLAQQAETAEYIGVESYMGRPHEKITFTQTDGPDLTITVNSHTGHISKMSRDLPNGKLHYHYQNHASISGIVFAQRVDLYVNNDVNSIVIARELKVNPRFSRSAFALDRGLREDTNEQINVSELAYRKVSDTVGHVGQGGAFSAFIDAGDYLVAVGGYPGLQARLDKFREETGNQKPLHYQIVSHHHTDHLGGMSEANDLGVVFVVHPAALANLRDAVSDEIPDDRLMIVENRTTLGDGAVKVYDITTSHAEHLLLTYASEPKATFMADHFGSPYVDYVPPAGLNGVRLHQAIEALGINVDVLLSAHSAGARSWAQFENAVAAYDPSSCKLDRAICANQ